MSTKRQFWLVWCINGGVPTVKHWTVGEARAESERLARSHPGDEFVVMAALCSVVKSDVVWHEYRDGIELPL